MALLKTWHINGVYLTIGADECRVHRDAVDLAIGAYSFSSVVLRLKLVLWVRAVPALSGHRVWYALASSCSRLLSRSHCKSLVHLVYVLLEDLGLALLSSHLICRSPWWRRRHAKLRGWEGRVSVAGHRSGSAEDSRTLAGMEMGRRRGL